MLIRLCRILLGWGLIILLSAEPVAALTLAADVGSSPLQNPTVSTQDKITPLDGYLPVPNVLSESVEGIPLTDYPRLQKATSPDTTSCFQTGFADWAHATNFITYTRRSNTTTTTELAMRYDGPTMPNYSVVVNGAYNWIRRIAEGAAGDGAARVQVSVYTDAGGLPGTAAYAETFVLPVHGNNVGYTYFPFTTPVVLQGAYHIGFRVDPAGPSTDTVVFTSDDAGYPGGTATSSGRARSIIQ